GPIELGASGVVDLLPGSVLIAPSQELGTVGLPVQVTIEPSPCDGGGAPVALAFSSGPVMVTIRDANNVLGQVLTTEDAGERFSCAEWTHENGPGRLVQGRPVLHVLNIGGMLVDAANLFILDD